MSATIGGVVIVMDIWSQYIPLNRNKELDEIDRHYDM